MENKLKVKVLFVCLTLLVGMRLSVYGQWSSDPNINTPVCLAPIHQEYPVGVHVGGGDVIITWADSRNGNYDIFAQYINKDGYTVWEADGIEVYADSMSQTFPKIVKGLDNEAIIVWCDYRSGKGDIYAQKVLSNGSIAWGKNGIPVCSAAGNQNNPKVVSDGVGGAIIAWEDERGNDGIFPDTSDIYAQRIDPSGNLLWAEYGIPICSAPLDQDFPDLITTHCITQDGNGGAVVVWEDYRYSGGSFDGELHVFAQRISDLGNTLWGANGLQITANNFRQYNPSIVCDTSNNIFIAWEFQKTSTDNDIYLQKLNLSGNFLFESGGIPVCTYSGYQRVPNVVSDDSGGAIITWYDLRANNFDVYAQRINSSGLELWTKDGVVVCDQNGSQFNPILTKDGVGGAVIIWRDNRVSTDWNIYAQRINEQGEKLWLSSGVAISTAPRDQEFPFLINCDEHGLIATWQDTRNIYKDIYVQRFDLDGTVGGPCAVEDSDVIQRFYLYQNYPNPFNPSTKIKYELNKRSKAKLCIYNTLGQKIATLVDAEQQAGTYEAVWNGEKYPSGVYYAKLETEEYTNVKKLILMR